MDRKIHCTLQPYGEELAKSKITVLQTEKL